MSRGAYLKCLIMTIPVAVTAIASAQNNLLANGGFESDLGGWSPSANSGSAAFSVETSQSKAGKHLRVNVASKGSGDPPSLVHGTFNTVQSSTYMLRFFARSSTVRPLMKVNIASATDSYTVDISPVSNGWEEYRYCFKSSGATVISFLFAAEAEFRLDEIQVLDQGDPVVDVRSSHLWQWGQYAYSQIPGNKILKGTDNSISAKLPNGDVAWIFNDTWTGTANFLSNRRGTGLAFPRNFMVRQTGGVLVPVSQGSVFDPADSANLYWATDAIVENDKLIVFLNEIGKSPLVDKRKAVARLSLPSLAIEAITNKATNWGVRLLDGGDGYIYIYEGAKVARVAVGSLGNQAQWRYYNNGVWSPNQGDAQTIPNLSPSTVERLGPENFVAMYRKDQAGSGMMAQFAPAPWGPWSTGVQVVATPGEAKTYYYMPYIHKHTAQNGVYGMSYSDNGDKGDDGADGYGISKRVYADMSHYNPHHSKTPDLLELSPYTRNAVEDDFSVQPWARFVNFGGDWSVAGGEYRTSSGSGHKSVVKGVVGSDFTLEADIKAGPGSGAGLIFRASEYGDGPEGYLGYYVSLKPGVGIAFGKNVGSGTALSRTASMPIAANQSYRVKVVAAGTSIKIHVDGIEKIALVDGSFPRGGFGFRVFNSSGAYDNLSFVPYTVVGEGEALPLGGNSGDPTQVVADAAALNGSYREFAADAIGDHLVIKVPVDRAGKYLLDIQMKDGPDRGRYGLSISSSPAGPFVDIGDQGLDTYGTGTGFSEFYNVAAVDVPVAGDRYVKVTVKGRNPASLGHRLAVDRVSLRMK